MIFHRAWVRAPNSAWPVPMEARKHLQSPPSSASFMLLEHCLSSPEVITFTKRKRTQTEWTKCFTKSLVHHFPAISIHQMELSLENLYKLQQVSHLHKKKCRGKMEHFQLVCISASLIISGSAISGTKTTNEWSNCWGLSVLFNL